MTNTNNQSMEDFLNNVQEVKIGETVQGEVLALEDKQVIVGIVGAGIEGVVPAKELSVQPVEDIAAEVSVGDILDLVVVATIGKDKENGSYLLSKRRIEAQKVWRELEEKFKAGEIIEAPVTGVVKGGLVVDAGVRGFVPASMVADYFIKDLSGYKGQTLALKIVEIDPAENRLVLSHKEILAAQKAEKKAETLAKLQEGDQIQGKVARLTNFGAFIDLGGIDGLVHISEISHNHVAKPSDVLAVGDDVSAVVLSIDPATDRIALSIKDTQEGPWDNIETKVITDSVVEGTVKRLTDFGAFVEILPGVEGLVHISQISHKHVANPNDVLKTGETIKAKVLEVKPTERRIALSMRALEEKPVSAAKEEVVVEETYELPEEQTGFTMGDILSDVLKTEE